MLGLTVAYRLAERGQAVTLFEAADGIGGLASAWSIGDVVWDRHYHVTLLSDSHTRGLLADLKLEHRLRWAHTRTAFFTDGQLYPMSNTLEFLRFPPLALPDKLRLAATIVYASRLTDWRRLEAIPVTDWLQRLSGPRTYERIWLPLLRAKLGENYARTSAAFIWATIRRMYAARRTGLKREMFGYVEGGYATVLAHFEQRLEQRGVRIRTSTAVTQVSRCLDRLVVHTASGSPDHFDQVVVTAPGPVAAHLCPDLPAEEAARLRGVEYQGIVCASVLLDAPLSPYYITNITEPGLPFTAVIDMSALVDSSRFGGRGLVYLPRYVSTADPFLALPDEAVRKHFVQGLLRVYPKFSPRQISAFRVSRARYVQPLHTLRRSDRIPAKSSAIPGLHFVSSAHIAHGTLNVNETVRLAEHSVRELLQDRA
jgi:protoporphyrinogen oxidase